MSLEDQLDGPKPKMMKFENEGDKVVGRVVNMGQKTSEHGAYRTLKILDKDGQLWAVAAFHKVLAGQLEDLSVGVGDEVAIRYEGRVTPDSGGNSYADYRVAVEHPPGWSPAPLYEDRAGAADRAAQEAAGEPPPVAAGADEDIPF